MVRIFLLIIVILLIRKLISLLGKRSSINFAKQNEASDNQDIVYNEQNSVYVFDDEDMLLIEKESQDSIKTGLNTIIKYIPNFKVARFIKSADQSVDMLSSVIENTNEEFQKIYRKKLGLLVEESYIGKVKEKKGLLEGYLHHKDFQLAQIYLLSFKAFILLKSLKTHSSWTFTKNLKDEDTNWYLTKIDDFLY